MYANFKNHPTNIWRMQEKDALIDIFDDLSKNIGHKFRHEINDRLDIVKQVNIVLLDDKRIFVTKAKGGLWPGKWGTTAAGLVRHDEALADAAKRTLKRETGITTELIWLGESMYNFDGIRRIMSIFHGKTKAQPKLNADDAEEGKWATVEEATKMDIMPTLAVALEIVKKVK